jgi:hypothetical protein
LLFVGFVLIACAPAAAPQFNFEDGARLFTLTVDGNAIKSEANDFVYKNDDYQILMRINARQINFAFVDVGKAVERFI